MMSSILKFEHVSKVKRFLVLLYQTRKKLR